MGLTYSSAKRRVEGKSPGATTSKIARSSVSEFSRGVPVTASLRGASMSRTTSWIRDADRR